MKALTAGNQQESVFGPTMRNVLYDGFLRKPMPEEVELIANADDVEITAKAKDLFKIE